jgi:hypothetical protein
MKYLLLILGLLSAFPVRAQEPAGEPVEEIDLLVAKVYVNETGLNLSHWRDHAGITHILRITGGREITREGICAYTGIICASRRRDSRRYINELNASGDEPRHWPSNLNWERDYRRTWLRYLERARSYRRATPRPCHRQTLADGIRVTGWPRHWGTIGFRRDYWNSVGWVELECPGAINAFWAPPR